jgi:hypothetical protein
MFHPTSFFFGVEKRKIEVLLKNHAIFLEKKLKKQERALNF